MDSPVQLLFSAPTIDPNRPGAQGPEQDAEVKDVVLPNVPASNRNTHMESDSKKYHEPRPTQHQR